MDLNEFYNPGKIMEEYLDFLPSKDAEAILFPMAKFPSKTFNVLDSETTLLYHVNKKIGNASEAVPCCWSIKMH